jgi:hypothetical protein
MRRVTLVVLKCALCWSVTGPPIRSPVRGCRLNAEDPIAENHRDGCRCNEEHSIHRRSD